jgi:hypothetical protein
MPTEEGDSLLCSKCGSENTSRVALEHLRGRQSWTGSVVGSEGLASLSGDTSNSLADLLAPPSPKDTGYGCGILFLAWTLVLSGMLGFLQLTLELQESTTRELSDFLGPSVLLVPTVIGLLILRSHRSAREIGERWNQQELPRLRAEWERQMFCGRCGHGWLPPKDDWNAPGGAAE